jgi:hypothetical protein
MLCALEVQYDLGTLSAELKFSGMRTQRPCNYRGASAEEMEHWESVDGLESPYNGWTSERQRWSVAHTVD